MSLNWHFKKTIVIFLMIPLLIILFAINRSIFITKEEMLEVAKNQKCSIRLELYFRDEITSYDTCIRALKNDFLNLSILDQIDVSAMFILYGKLDAGSSLAFIELIQPEYISILKKLENFSDLEIRNNFKASDAMIIDYRKTVYHYKELFDRELKESMIEP